MKFKILVILASLLLAIGCGDDGSNAGGNPNNGNPSYNNSTTANDPEASNNAESILGVWTVNIDYLGERYTYRYTFTRIKGTAVIGYDHAGNTVGGMYNEKEGYFVINHYIDKSTTLGLFVSVYGNEMEGCMYPRVNGEVLSDYCNEVYGTK